jgi:hypothetical protein
MPWHSTRSARLTHGVRFPEDSADAADELRIRQWLGEDVRYLLGGVDFDQAHHPILDVFMRKMLAEVNVLSAFTSPDDMVAPFDARGVVLVHRDVWGLRKSHVLEEVPEANNLNSHLGSGIVLCLGGRQGDGLLHFRSP